MKFSLFPAPSGGRAKSALRLLLAALSGSVLTALPVRAQDSGQKTVGVTFDPAPVESGLTFDRTGVKATRIEVNGTSTDTWMALQGSDPARGWVRAFRFKVTAPEFQRGHQPVVDLEINYCSTARYGVAILADAGEGVHKIASAGGSKNKEWKTLKVPLNDAFFGGRPALDVANPSLNGFDLYISASSGDIYLREVRLVGYDLKNQVDWKRVLGIQEIATATPGGELLFARDTRSALTLPVRNAAQVDKPVRYHFEVSDDQDKTLSHSDGTALLKASSTQGLPVELNTAGWRLGPCTAKLDLYAEGASAAPIATRSFACGVITGAALDKARPGEFLYGLDPANSENFHNHGPAGLEYYRLMGVDILRNLWEIKTTPSVEAAGATLSELKAQNLQATLMQDPIREPDTPEGGKRAAETEAMLKEIARRHGGSGPGKIHFFELGNEPDLTGFYPGPMADYVASYEAMYDAIKSGAAAGGLSPQDTVVTSGGLSFARAEGDRRSREFLYFVDPKKIDAIAYHGHGPGIKAERSAYERVRAAAEEAGKTGYPFVETESGMMASGREAGIAQAATVVEKMVYAQSVGMPMFHYFRLFMEGGDSGYSMTDNVLEPHPSVLSYRNLVERLRHRRFARKLDLAGAAQGVDGYLFAEEAAGGNATGGKTLVVFSEDSRQTDLRLQLAEPGAPAVNAMVYDLFGNASPALAAGANVVSVAAGPNPVFVAWNSAGDNVRLAKPLLEVAVADPLLEGSTTMLSLAVTNPRPQAARAEVAVESFFDVTAHVEPARQKLDLPVRGEARVPLTVKLASSQQPLRLPIWWKVFVDADPARAGEKFSTLPDSVPDAQGAPKAGQYVWTPECRLPFAKVAGSYSEKRPALALAYLDSPRDTDLLCAASADWWMAWYVNGVKVYDTLEKGNGGGGLSSHLFSLPLKAGRNVVAVLSLSGKDGWTVAYGGPRERSMAVYNGKDPNRLEITLKAEDGSVLARQTLPVPIGASVPVLGSVGSLDSPATWMNLEPLAVPDGTAIHNLWEKEPEQSRWYGGEKDLSGRAWLRDEGATLQLFVAVTDDKLAQAATPADLRQGDGLRVVIADDAGQPCVDLVTGLVNGRASATGTTAGSACTVNRQEAGAGAPLTTYRISIPKKALPAAAFRLSFSVLDNDAGFLKQTLDFGNVESPRQGVHLQCRAPLP